MKLKIIKNPDKAKHDEMAKACKDNDNYCPCLIERTKDTLCMCKDFREQTTEGLCHCQRFMKIFAD